jgi:hypothetical protein
MNDTDARVGAPVEDAHGRPVQVVRDRSGQAVRLDMELRDLIYTREQWDQLAANVAEAFAGQPAAGED